MSDWSRKRQSNYNDSYGGSDDTYQRQRDNTRRRSRDTRYYDREKRDRSRSQSRDGQGRGRGQGEYMTDTISNSNNRKYSSNSYASAPSSSHRIDQPQNYNNNPNNHNSNSQKTRYSHLTDDNYYQQQQHYFPDHFPDHLKDKSLTNQNNDINGKNASHPYQSVSQYSKVPSILPRRKGDEIVFRFVPVAPHALEKNFIKKRLTKLFPTLCELEFDDPRTRAKIYLEFRLETSIPPVLLSGGKMHTFDKFQLHLLPEEEMKNEDPSIVRQDGYKDATASLEKIDKLDPYAYCMEHVLGMCDSKDRCGLKHLGTKIERDRLLNRMKFFPCKNDPCFRQNCIYLHDYSRSSAPNLNSQVLTTNFPLENPIVDPSSSLSDQEIIQRVYDYIYNRPGHKILSTEIKDLYLALPFCTPLIKGAALKFFGKHPDKFATMHDGIAHKITAIIPGDSRFGSSHDLAGNIKNERNSFMDSQSNNMATSRPEPLEQGFLASNDLHKKSVNQNDKGPKSWSDLAKNSQSQPMESGFDHSYKDSSLNVEQFIKDVSQNLTSQTKAQQQSQISNNSSIGMKTSSPTVDNINNYSSYPSSDRMPPQYPTYMDTNNIHSQSYAYGSGYPDDRVGYGSMQMNTSMTFTHPQPYMPNPTMIPMQMANSMMQPQQMPPMQAQRSQIVCDICQTMFRDEAHLLKHMRESRKHLENKAKKGLL